MPIAQYTLRSSPAIYLFLGATGMLVVIGYFKKETAKMFSWGDV